MCSTCEVMVSGGGSRSNWKTNDTTNFIEHLPRHHPDVHQEYLATIEKKEDLKKKGTPMLQLSLQQYFDQGVPYGE